eukprot:TRINITY_DN29720_c0_g1_i1.p1 TRINITY_DN29720_c0_g1~~TRINITY_DN29720_c0_g1_i1.p1  ORF type:complete len:162 (-),score=10.40 TRINITY_DN29720_c0_g1_i1:249-734(-)
MARSLTLLLLLPKGKVWPELGFRFRSKLGLGLGFHPLAAVLLVFCISSLSFALCTFHHHRRRREKEETHFPSKVGVAFRKVLNITLAKKALLQARRKKEHFQRTEENQLEDGDETIWRRNILMGERCRPPNFSGAILYDDKGNRLPHFPVRSSNRSSFTST